MSYTNLNNPANYQLQSFGQNGVRTISTTQLYIEGEYYRVLVAEADSYVTAVSVLGDDLTDEFVYAGTTIYGLFTEVSVSSGSLTAYIAGPTDIDDVWAYIRAYGEANGATIEAEQCAKDAIEPLLDKYYAQASLVMVPSLYKTSIVYSERPLSTDGQLAFTRSNDTATRVNADGLIEKVRTNLCLNSQNQLASNWLSPSFPTTGVVTASTTVDPLGGTNAFKLAYGTGAQLATIVTATVGTTYTASIWVRRVTGSTQFKFFDTNNVATIFDIDGTWQRFSVTSTANTVTGRLYVQVYNPSSEIEVFGAQFETGDIATEYIPTTTAAVSVGPVANLPRLNYPINSDGSVGCPSLLLEPQRTNLITYSEQFNNAAWTSSGTTITANQSVSSDGYTNADKLTEDSSNGIHLLSQTTAATAGVYTASVFAKANGRNWLFLNIAAAGSYGAYFNLSNGTTGTIQSNITSAKIEDYGDGWYRCSITADTTTPAVSPRIAIYLATGDNTTVYTGDGTSGLYFWGAQLEAGAYPTSYIPTLVASVTRGADTCSKTGISSLIGQTEGTFFVDFEYLDGQSANNENWFALESNAGNDRVLFYKGTNQKQRILITANGSTVYDNTNLFSISASTRYKLAVRYDSGNIAVYMNGSQLVTSTNTYTRTDNLNNITFNESNQPLSSRFNQMMVFTQGVTNAQLAELTTL